MRRTHDANKHNLLHWLTMLQALNHKQVEGYLQRAFGQQLQVRLEPASYTI